MKLIPEELAELQYYLDAFTSEVKISFRKENSEILEFIDYNLVLYKAKVNVMRADPKTKEATTKKEVVYFLETHTQDIRRNTSFSDVCLAAIIYMAADDIRTGFDLVRQEWLLTHPEHMGSRRLQ